MKKSLHIFKRLRSAILVSKARSLASRSKFGAASLILLKIFALYGHGGPSPATPLIANVFFADLCERQGNTEAAFRACEIAIRQMDDGIDGDRVEYRIDNINYLKFKCKWILSRVSKFRDSIAFEMIKNINVKYDSLNIGNTNSLIRNLFPIDRQSANQLDEFIKENSTLGAGDA